MSHSSSSFGNSTDTNDNSIIIEKNTPKTRFHNIVKEFLQRRRTYYNKQFIADILKIIPKQLPEQATEESFHDCFK